MPFMESGELQRVGVFQRVPQLIINFIAGAVVLLVAFAGFCTGGIAGALAGKASDSGVARGAGLGAVAGTILSIEIFEASREFFRIGWPGSRRSSLMAEITEELICWRFEEENLVAPAELLASAWQVNFADISYRDINAFYGRVESRGLSRDLLKKLPCHEIIGGTRVARGLCCTICLQDLEVGEIARTLPLCQHTFHLACVDKWLIRHASCPVCRQDV